MKGRFPPQAVLFLLLVFLFGIGPIGRHVSEKEILASQYAANLMVVDFPSRHLDEDFIQRWINEKTVAGIWLWQANMDTAKSVRKLIQDLRSLAPFSVPFFGIDHEGGRVNRFRYFFGRFPPARSLATLTPETRNLPFKAAGQLRSLGIPVNFGPVADLDFPGSSLGDRAISADPDIVAQRIAAWIQAAKKAKVISFVKHFPGHWPSCGDTHLGPSQTPITLKQWYKFSGVPFQRAFAEGVEGVMLSHCSYPALAHDLGAKEAESRLPAPLSATIVKAFLRQKLGFKGVVISDALNMPGITDRASIGAAAVDAVNAGVDLIMVRGARATEVHEALKDAIVSGKISAARLSESSEKIAALKAKILADGTDKPNLSF